MRKITIGFLLLFSSFLQAQLEVNNPADTTPSDIVMNWLLGAGVTPLNIKFNNSAVNATSVNDQCGFFWMHSNPTNLGFLPGDKGALLTTGKNSVAKGPNTSQGMYDVSQIPNPSLVGDSDLLKIAEYEVKNVSILEFDFVATGDKLTFDYVFGSEEYPEYVNAGYNDAFGFFLSGPNIAGGKGFANDAENIAVLPDGSPVNINNVNDAKNSQYYVNNLTVPPSLSTQYDGFTTLLTAKHALRCGETYHIKLAIGNVGDNSWDSGVFISNFTIPPTVLSAIGLSDNPQGYCNGDLTINSGVTDPTYKIEWYKDADLLTGPGTNGPDLVISTAGDYCVKVYTDYGCLTGEDCITITYKAPLPINDPKNLTRCASLPQTFNINQNADILNNQPASNYDIKYYDTKQDAEVGSTGRIPNSALAAYTLTSPQTTIWARIVDINESGCVVIKPFDILVNKPPTAGTLSYSSGAYYGNNSTPQNVANTATPGGVYTASPQGLSIDAAGTIIPSSSAVGTYSIVYTIPTDGVCPDYSTDPISVIIEDFTGELNTLAFTAQNILVYPNPASNQVHIHLNNGSQTLHQIEVYDIVGKCIKRAVNVSANETTLDVSVLSKGVYLIEITTESQLKLTKKLVIE